jgi:SAM-dependent methyltransferase
MEYFDKNKEAWDEAFKAHEKGYANNPIPLCLNQNFAFLNNDLVNEFKSLDIEKKHIAQFCCNNGREILSLIDSGAKSGVGFDMSQNFTDEGKRIAKEKRLNCDFVCTNILDIDSKFENEFDIVFCTIGTFCWFEKLESFFNIMNMVLKQDGIFLISEAHPVIDIFAREDEKVFENNNPERIVYSYFRTEPWVENDGIDYVGNTKYKSKTFVSFSHTLSDVINGIVKSGLNIIDFKEFAHSLDRFEHLENGKIPLSYLIKGQK